MANIDSQRIYTLKKYTTICQSVIWFGYIEKLSQLCSVPTHTWKCEYEIILLLYATIACECVRLVGGGFFLEKNLLKKIDNMLENFVPYGEVNNSSLPLNQKERKDNAVDFVRVLMQFPTYTYKGESGWFIAKEVCDKMGYANAKQLSNLVVDNKDEVVLLEGEDYQSFTNYNNIVGWKRTSHLIILGTNAFLEIVNRSTHPSFACLRSQSRDVLYRYIKGEEVSIQKDLGLGEKPRESKKWLLDAIGTVYAQNSMYYQRAVAVIANEECPMLNLPLPTIETEEFVLSADDVAKRLSSRGFKFAEHPKWTLTTPIPKGMGFLGHAWSIDLRYVSIGIVLPYLYSYLRLGLCRALLRTADIPKT